jgi:two-component system, NarL family, invasion response regulator UvrY
VIKVLVADDHAVVRKGVRQILDDAADIVVIGEAGSIKETIRQTRLTEFDVLLLDIKMPDGSGLEALKQIKEIKPEVQVCMLSIFPEHQYAVRAFRSGASGYLTKESAPDELILALRKVSQGGKYVSEKMAEIFAEEMVRESADATHADLSDREFQVMCKLAEGKRITEVAQELALSEKTVSTYRTRIIAKLGLKSTGEIIRYAIENDLIDRG